MGLGHGSKSRLTVVSFAGSAREKVAVDVRKGKTRETHRDRFFENVPLLDGEDAVPVDWIGFEILDAKGVVRYRTALITSLPVTKADVAETVACDRARGKSDKKASTSQKARLRTRIQSRPWRDPSRHDARCRQHARLHQAFNARYPRAALETRSRGRRYTKTLLRLPLHHRHPRDLSRPARPP